MRPTKLLTISAIAGLSLISYGRSAHAETKTVSLSGIITPACTLDTTNSTGFSENTIDPGVIPSTQLVANNGARGKVVVTCNGATSLDLEIDGNNSKYYNGNPAIRFVGTTNSIFPVVAINPYKELGTPISLSLLAPTKSSGDIGYIEARILAPTNGKLLKAADDYNLVVNVKITP
jgi:hypothetical protein